MDFNEKKLSKEHVLDAFIHEYYMEDLKKFDMATINNFFINAIKSENIGNLEALVTLTDIKKITPENAFNYVFLASEGKDFKEKLKLLHSIGLVEKSMFTKQNVITELLDVNANEAVEYLTEECKYSKYLGSSFGYISKLVRKLDVLTIKELDKKGFTWDLDELLLSTLHDLSIKDEKDVKNLMEILPIILPPEKFDSGELKPKLLNRLMANWFAEKITVKDLNNLEKMYKFSSFDEKSFSIFAKKITEMSGRWGSPWSNILEQNKCEKIDYLLNKKFDLTFLKNDLLKSGLLNDATEMYYKKLNRYLTNDFIAETMKNSNLFQQMLIKGNINSLTLLSKRYSNYEEELIETIGFDVFLRNKGFAFDNNKLSFNNEENNKIFKQYEKEIGELFINKSSYKMIVEKTEYINNNDFITTKSILNFAIDNKNEHIVKLIAKEFDLTEAFYMILAVKLLNTGENFPESRYKILENIDFLLTIPEIKVNPLLADYITIAVGNKSTYDENLLTLKSLDQKLVLYQEIGINPQDKTVSNIKKRL